MQVLEVLVTLMILLFQQIIGFFLLVLGMCLYNNIINSSLFKCAREIDSDPLMGAVDDHSINPNDEETRPSIIH